MGLPTILVPGIKGTTLVNVNTLDFDTIWSGIQSKFETIYDLALQPDPRFEAERKAIIERSDVEDLAYREAVVIIEKEIASPVYIFGYDWRRSCRENGKALKAYVDYLKKKLGMDRFHFLTHSMGGMIFSCYLSELGGNFDEVAGAVLTVCPFQGSINALVALIVGEGGSRFPLFNSNDVFRKIARTFPSVYELAPVFPGAVAFDQAFKPGIPFDLYDPALWQSNVAAGDTPAKEMFRRRLAELKDFRIGRPAMLDLASLPQPVRDRLVIVAGRGEKTRDHVLVKQTTPDGRAANFFDFAQPDGDGDGTVPLVSATKYKADILTLAVQSKWYDGATHGFFLNDGRVQTIIKRFFNGDTAHKEWWTDIARTVERVL